MFRHEYKVEYLCKFENPYSIGISKRGCNITQSYRYLLYKSRQFCINRMKGHTTREECDFCGCVFALSFIREPYFQEHVLKSIQTGFKQWYVVTSQINSFRGIRNSNFQKTMLVILREIGMINFNNPSLTTLDLYFARCSITNSNDPSSIPGFSMNVKRKLTDVSLSGVMHSITSSIRFGRPSSEKGTSKNFYGNAVKKSQTLIDPEEVDESSAEKNDPPFIDLYSDFDLEEDMDSAARAYRRQSMMAKSPIGMTVSEIEVTSPSPYSPPDVIECTAAASSALGSQLGLELDIANNEEILKFELLNPSFFFWNPIYEYINKHSSKQHRVHVEKEDWYSILIHNGGVYIAFVNFYHQYICSVGKGDIAWSKIPGYAHISVTVPLMMMEYRFQNRSTHELAFYIGCDQDPIHKVYPNTCFRLNSVSKDKHPILESIQILPKLNPHLTFACLTAVFSSTNILLFNDVTAYLARCKEIIEASYKAKLSYYQSARDRCTDDSLISDVIEANESLRSPGTPRESSPTRASPFSIHGFRSLFSPKKVTQSVSEPNLTTSKTSKSRTTSTHNLYNVHIPSPARETSPVVSPGRARQASICTLRFQEQIENSLINLSRIAALTALQFQTILSSELCGSFLYAISVMYDFQKIMTEGDFHIFINTLLFNNTKYSSRYSITEIILPSHMIPKHPQYPNMLSRLFCHWSVNVCDYLHLLLVYRIIVVNRGGYSDLQRLLISAFETTVIQLRYHTLLYHDYPPLDDEESLIDYCEVGRKMVMLLQRNNAKSLLNQVQEALQNHAYTDYSMRLAMELDIHLFTLILEDSSDSFLYHEPNCSYMLYSLGRFSKLLYNVYFSPGRYKAPMVLNASPNNIGNGA